MSRANQILSPFIISCTALQFSISMDIWVPFLGDYSTQRPMQILTYVCLFEYSLPTAQTMFDICLTCCPAIIHDVPTDRHLDITFRLQVIESSSLVSVLFREAFN